MSRGNVIAASVVIVGGGPAGLSAARELAPKLGPGQVLVLERESTAGGIPRHSDHPGYGMRDMRRFMSGPAYARKLVREAESAGATIRTNAMVTGWAGDRSLEVTTPEGRLLVEASAVILATGARERPRPARLIPGDRPSGVYTTGHLQQLVHLEHGRVGRKAVIVGAELVSWSAALTLREAGCSTELMTTTYEKPDSYFFFTLPGRLFFRTKVATRTTVTRIIGRPALEAVEIENIDTGRRRIVECDTLILTGDWIPDHELARSGGIELDPGTKGPLVDEGLRTKRPGVFAIGNVLHPVDTADIAAIDGAHVVPQVLAWLNGQKKAPGGVRLVADAPFRWIAPGLLAPGSAAPARHRLLLWSDRYIPFPTVVVRQDGRVVARKRLLWPAAPGRVFRIPSRVLKSVSRSGGAVHVGVE
jgi:NADPH-dependent 2,4-dienoyl-CoA reductase/sulfur reductase-like enzyme